MATDSYTVSSSKAIAVEADETNRKTVLAVGSTVYYGAQAVSAASNDGSLATGTSVTISKTAWFISAGQTVLTVADVEDVALVVSPRVPAVVATSLTYGTDKTPVITETYFAEIAVSGQATFTGVEYLIGSVGGTDKAVVALFNSAGAVVANSALAGTTVGTTATFQRIAFTAPYLARGPAQYFVGLQVDGTTARFRTIPVGPRLAAGKKTSETFGTLTTITVPTTFTADLGPVAGTY